MASPKNVGYTQTQRSADDVIVSQDDRDDAESSVRDEKCNYNFLWATSNRKIVICVSDMQQSRMKFKKLLR